MLPFELKKDTPYLALSGELWSVFYEYFNRNWPCYKGFLLYLLREQLTNIATADTHDNQDHGYIYWLAPGRCVDEFKRIIFKYIIKNSGLGLIVKLFSGERHRSSLKRSQHWFW